MHQWKKWDLLCQEFLSIASKTKKTGKRTSTQKRKIKETDVLNKKTDREKWEPRSEVVRKIRTLSASHIFTVLSKEDVAKRFELGLNRTSVMRRECPSEVLMDWKVSMFQIKTWKWKVQFSSELMQKERQTKFRWWINPNHLLFMPPTS